MLPEYTLVGNTVPSGYERLVRATRALLDMVTDGRTHGPEVYEVADALKELHPEDLRATQ